VGSPNPIVDGVTVAFSNPTALVFYAAFFPQFIDPDHSVSEQVLQLGAMYLCTALLFDLAFVVAFARIRLPARLTRLAGIAECGSAVVYLAIAVITVVGFMKASN
jgi:threonine/homoserine/homoserine lactone efflux protein